MFSKLHKLHVRNDREARGGTIPGIYLKQNLHISSIFIAQAEISHNETENQEATQSTLFETKRVYFKCFMRKPIVPSGFCLRKLREWVLVWAFKKNTIIFYMLLVLGFD